MNTMTKTDNRAQSDNRVAESQQTQRRFVSPRVNITETKDGYLLEAEMPGVNKEGLELLLENNELTLVGHRGDQVRDLQLIYRESGNYDFRRSFALDPTIDTAHIEAKIENGVLRLKLPKAEKVKPRKIAVTD